MNRNLTGYSGAKTEGNQASFLIRSGANQEENDVAVWSAFREGNRKAFDYIFQRHVRLLYTYGSRISSDQGLVEDCIQDLFVDLWNKHSTLGETNNIKFYLLTSLRRRIVRRLASDKRLHFDASLEDDYTTEIEFSVEFDIIREQVSAEQRRNLTHALSQLSKRQREAVYLKFYEHMSYEEIGAMMKLEIKSTYNLIGKAIDSLRKTIQVPS